MFYSGLHAEISRINKIRLSHPRGGSSTSLSVVKLEAQNTKKNAITLRYPKSQVIGNNSRMDSIQITTVVTFIFIAISIKTTEGCYKPCDGGYIKFEHTQTCIRLSRVYDATWERARTVCQNEGGDLVKVLDKETNDFLAHLISTEYSVRYWIGFNKKKKNGTYLWLDEVDEQSNYTNWAVHEPNNDDTEFCVEIWSKAKWNNMPCDSSLRYICEKPAECTDGYYGKDCKKKCKEVCGGLNNPCNRVNGTCEKGCDPGYQGAFCSKRCDFGSYGEGCAKTCNERCRQYKKKPYCNAVDGSCYCQMGYYGKNCTNSFKSSSWTKNGAIVSVVLVVGVVAVSAAFALGSLLWRARLNN
ncbi:hypothetical protein RRG08_013411 [Elysia crispata]|uniref:C-type lectin domain-containing protein n=1 Tax=Elysia crispata TaxID=231223 RepID=A0AAE0ZNH1_9GAST|nr:hypothetical protein RRG08_013411 [Elysia crispata]